MDVICTYDAGLDVHKRTVMACWTTPDRTGQQVDRIMKVKKLSPLTRDVLAWPDWMPQVGIMHVAEVKSSYSFSTL